MTAYDVIVVGAGGSGAPLAARLSEDPGVRVLLVEAGEAPASVDGFPSDLLDAGLLTGAMPGNRHSWSYVANLTPDLRYTVVRGRILGGSTALNGTYFVRGRPADFDEYAALGNDLWSWENVLPSFIRLERDLEYGASAEHGDRGPVPVFRVPRAQLHEVSRLFLEASRSLGFPSEADKNGSQTPGAGVLPVNAVDGRRMNTAITYLLPHRDRANLTVWGRARARRVLFDGPTVRGLEVERDGSIQEIGAPSVVLCAGAIGSPHLLALSGVGPREELEAAGIPIVADVPGVGKGFTDHPETFLNWRPRRRLAAYGRGDAFQVALNLRSAGHDRGGYCGDEPREADLEIMPMLRPLTTLLGGTVRRPWGALRVARHPIAALRAVRGVSLRHLARQVAHSRELAFIVAVQRARSRGEITTMAADPHRPPRIDYHYLGSEHDRRRMREGVRTAVAILRSPAYSRVFGGFSELPDEVIADDRLLDDWMRAHLATAIHAAGSCAMGRDPAAGAVVDQRGRVHGVSGLRVADTSILPFATSRGLAATAVMIGERMAELIRDAHPANPE